MRLCVLLVVASVNVVSAAAPRQPNILWLSCEDLSPRLGCYGDKVAQTPNLDQLAGDGVRYTHAFTATGVCAPCRHTIITGLYPMQSGAQYMRTGSYSSASAKADQIRPLYEATPPAGVRCFTEYLRMAGYYCANNSKEDYQFKAPVMAWDDSSREAHYRNRPKGQPFFAVFNATVTHESGIHGEKLRSPRVTDPADVRVPSFLPDTPVVRDDIARHYDNIAALDKWVGERLAELDAEGLADDTIVFFFSDHGDGLPRHKRWVYDSGTHVPLIVRWPDGRRAGDVEDRLVSFVDLAPTVLSLADRSRPDGLPGKVFCGPDADGERDYVFMHRDRMDDTAHETIRSVRDQRYRYVRNYRPDQPYLLPIAYRDRAATMGEIYRLRDAGELTPPQWQWAAETKPREELYDTVADPDEVMNLIDDPQHAEKLAELRAALDAWIERIDDPLATDEVDVLKTRIWPPDGKQPVTAPPKVEYDQQRRMVTISCDTPGASLGYRLPGQGVWRVYDRPFRYESIPPMEYVAHRLGWKPAKNGVPYRE